MPNKLLAITVFALVLPPGLPARAAEPADLRPKFAKGHVVYYRGAQRLKQSINLLGQAMDSDIIIERGMRLSVKDVAPGGGAELELTCLYLVMDGSMPQTPPIKFDSRKPAEDKPDSPEKALRSVVGKPVVLTISADGKVEKVTGADKVTAELRQAGPFGRPIAHLYAEDVLRHSPLFPGRNAPRPAEVGATWDEQNESDSPGMGVIVNASTYTLEQLSANHTAEIALKSRYHMKPADSDARGAVTLDDGQAEGRFTWDLAAGELQKAALSLDMTLKFTPPGGDSDNQSSMKQKVTAALDRTTLKEFHLPPDAADRK